MERIGIVGLGRMGRAMARRFADQGWPVDGWTRSGIAPDAAAALGIAGAPTLAALVARSDILVLSLFDDAAVTEVVAALCALDLRGRLIMDTSTVVPAVLHGLIGQVRAAGGGAVDAPISGGPEMVAAGTCGVFIGGEADEAARAASAARALSGRVVHVGPLGAGLAMKVVNNALLQGYFVTLTEVTRIARRAGLDFELAMRLLADGPAATGMFRARLPRILGEDDSVGFSVADVAKDTDVFLRTAEALGVDAPSLKLAQAMMAGGLAAGLGERDVAALIPAAWRAP